MSFASSTTTEPGLAPGFSRDVREAIRAAAEAGLKSLPRRGAEIGGLLTTSSPAGSAPIIGHAELIDIEHRYGPGYRLSKQDLSRLRARADQLGASSGERVAGFFRSCTADPFTFAPSDLDVLREQLPECSLLVIVKPFADGHATVRVFQPLGADWSQTEEFELVREAPAAVAKAVTATLPETRPSEPPVSAIRPRIAPPPPSAKHLPWQQIWIAAAVLMCVVLAIGAVLWLRPRPLETAGLGVVLEPAGDRLRLTWNRETPAVRSATAGVIRIDDGAAHREILLDPQQLSSGSILYRPASRDVTFRLEIRGERRTVGETVRMVDGVGPVPPEARQTAVVPAPQKPDLRPAFVPQKENPAVRQEPVAVAQNPPSPQQKQAPVPVAKPDQRPAPPVELPLPPALTPQAPREPALMPAAPVPPAYQKAWEPIPSVMHYLNDRGVTPPFPVLKVMPRITRPITTSEITEVRILVAIDVQGRVAGAQSLDTNVNPALVKRAIAAARQWKFEPALDRGRKVPATYTITFRFRPPG